MKTDITSDNLRAALDRHASAGRVALDGPDGPISYAALRDAIDSAAAAFQSWGLLHGEPVGILGHRALPAIAAFLGAMQAGACPCFLEPKLAAEAYVARMTAVGMRHLVLDPGLLPEASGLEEAGIRLHDLGGSFGAARFPPRNIAAARPRHDAVHLRQHWPAERGRPVASESRLQCAWRS